MAAEDSAESKKSDPTTAAGDLPRRKDGFRERGGAVTRAEAFVDAAFAFAVTLLVIRESSEIPNVAALTQSLLQIPAFATSFALVCLIWFSHHTWSRRFGLDDTGSVVRSLCLVFLLLVMFLEERLAFWVAAGIPFALLATGGFLYALVRIQHSLQKLNMRKNGNSNC